MTYFQEPAQNGSGKNDKPVAEERECAEDDNSGQVLQQEVFDKVVYAVGSETIAKYPDIEGLEKFEGRFLHGQAFKRYVCP